MRFLIAALALWQAFAIGAPIAAAAIRIAFSIGASALARRLSQTDTPQAEDGKINLRQNVPPRVVACGLNKKGGDYILLEEKDGNAYHITSVASHRIEGFLEHWLHDEPLEMAGTAVVTPEHFAGHVTIETRAGLSTETAYGPVVAAMPEIWTSSHRGDGLASVLMIVESVPEADYREAFPQAMPEHTAVFEGALLYDPRSETTAYSENLALIRLHHLMHESGGRLSLADIYAPDWESAADVCDEIVTNREDDEEARYHGGGWWRYNNRPVDVGREIDEAAELVVYQRADGTIGVHAGEYVEPDITIGENAIHRIAFDGNRRRSGSVLAVRGRYTSIEHGFNTVDAAIHGSPYEAEDSDRSAAIETPWVRSHNHMNRLQKLRFIRANAPRVSVEVDYEAGQDIPYRRFVRIDVPPRLDNVVVEVIGRPKISLARLTISFDGIIVPESLFDFDAATEEGEPPPVPEAVEGTSLEPPENIEAELDSEAVGGVTQVFARITWDEVGASISYEVEYGRAGDSVTIVSVPAGTLAYTTPALADVEAYRFRVRSVSGGGARSAWSAYVTIPDALLADAETMLLAAADTTLHI